jgi:hypothetical protein
MNWARQDPASTADWVSGFSNPELREVAIRNVVQEWATQSPQQAGAWLAGMPQEGWRDQVMAEFVTQIARDQGDVAAQYADQIRDADLRAKILKTIARE